MIVNHALTVSHLNLKPLLLHECHMAVTGCYNFVAVGICGLKRGTRGAIILRFPLEQLECGKFLCLAPDAPAHKPDDRGDGENDGSQDYQGVHDQGYQLSQADPQPRQTVAQNCR